MMELASICALGHGHLTAHLPCGGPGIYRAYREVAAYELPDPGVTMHSTRTAIMFPILAGLMFEGITARRSKGGTARLLRGGSRYESCRATMPETCTPSSIQL